MFRIHFQEAHRLMLRLIEKQAYVLDYMEFLSKVYPRQANH